MIQNLQCIQKKHYRLKALEPEKRPWTSELFLKNSSKPSFELFIKA